MNATRVENVSANRHSTGSYIRFWSDDVRVDAAVGSYVVLDDSVRRPCGERLLKGDPEPIGSGWPGCDFRWPNPVPGWETSRAIACNIHVTGRVIRYGEKIGLGDGYWVRVSIEWVGDCEPSKYGSGWMKVEL